GARRRPCFRRDRPRQFLVRPSPTTTGGRRAIEAIHPSQVRRRERPWSAALSYDLTTLRMISATRSGRSRHEKWLQRSTTTYLAGASCCRFACRSASLDQSRSPYTSVTGAPPATYEFRSSNHVFHCRSNDRKARSWPGRAPETQSSSTNSADKWAGSTTPPSNTL